jgi:predicted transcriptional regulator
MSGKISGQVWDLDLPHREMFVLLAITDHADHDGNNMHPSVDLVAWKTGFSRRTVIRILNKLVDRGVLVRVTRPGYTSMYSANLDAAPKKKARPKVKRTRDTAMTHVNLSPVPTSRVKRTGGCATPSANLAQEPSVETSIDQDEVLTERQKATRALYAFYERASGHMGMSIGARMDMDALAEEYSLAKIEAAIEASEGRTLNQPFAYLRRVLMNVSVVPKSTPAATSGPWGRELT